MKSTKHLVFDVTIYSALRHVALVTGMAVFMVFVTIKAEYPPGILSYSVFCFSGVTAFLFGQAVKESLAIICYQMAICTEDLKKNYSSCNNTEEK
ncbi:hypothetical protein MLW94_19845 [Escherichia coli]|nr:hypothetical protein [Escherichia coli]